MRAVVQRVTQAAVKVEETIIARIETGLLVFLGIGREDTVKDMEYLVNKVARLRVFMDEEEKMNRSVMDIAGEVLVVSQFTLYGDGRHGNRPSFIEAMPPEEAIPLYEGFCEALEGYGLKVSHGQFQAQMEVSLVNDGPVTILLDSNRGF